MAHLPAGFVGLCGRIRNGLLTKLAVLRFGSVLCANRTTGRQKPVGKAKLKTKHTNKEQIKINAAQAKPG
eukprot:6213098-Pleurochrysis_carterae.AAC.2